MDNVGLELYVVWFISVETKIALNKGRNAGDDNSGRTGSTGVTTCVHRCNAIHIPYN